MIKKIVDFLKRLFKQKNEGFTLVELLIVIALIGILAGAVVATLNPIEQINKANDAKAANDAAEELNALERYYASQNRYPWNAIDSLLTVDQAYGIRSNEVGFGICSAETVTDSYTDCDGTKTGILIDTDELKGSFANKSYFDKDATETDKMYLYKFANSGAYPNAIYVCYVPKAKVNRTSANILWDLDFVNGEPSGMTKADPASDFDSEGNVIGTFADADNSWFKCMPE